MSSPSPSRSPVPSLAGLAVLGAAEVVSLAVYAAVTFQQLPARYPSHFNAQGVADAWARGDSPIWFFVPAVAAGLWLVLALVSFAVTGMPLSNINLPQKALALALPPEMQDTVKRLVGRLILIVGAFIVAASATVQWMMADVAIGGAPRPKLTPVFAMVGVTLLVAIVQSVGVSRRIRAMSAETRDEARL